MHSEIEGFIDRLRFKSYIHSAKINFINLNITCRTDVSESYARLYDYLPVSSISGSLEGSAAEYNVYHVEGGELVKRVNDLAKNHTEKSTYKTIFREKTLKERYCGKYRIYFSNAPDEFIAIGDDEDIFLITSSPETSKNNFLRVIREVILRESQNRGGVVLHASSFQIKEKGVLLVGKSGAGKTTLLNTFLENALASFITNDRTIFSSENNCLYSFPLPIRYGLGTLINSKLFNYIRDNYSKLKRAQLIDEQTFNKLNSQTIGKYGDTKIEFDPASLCRILQVPFLEKSEVNLIIVPRFESENILPAFSKIRKTEIRRLLKDECYTPHDPLWKEDWIQPLREIEALEQEALLKIDRLAEMPAYTFTFGPGLKNYIEAQSEQLLELCQN